MARRSKTQRENDLTLISDLYLAGYTQMQIADSINKRALKKEWNYKISRVQVSHDIKLIHERWQIAQVNNIDTHKSILLQKIDRMENAAWIGWERSLKKHTKTKTKTNIESEIEITNEEWTTEGNPAFLAIVDKAITQRSKILGIGQNEEPKPTDIQIVFERVRKKYDANDE